MATKRCKTRVAKLNMPSLVVCTSYGNLLLNQQHEEAKSGPPTATVRHLTWPLRLEEIFRVAFLLSKPRAADAKKILVLVSTKYGAAPIDLTYSTQIKK